MDSQEWLVMNKKVVQECSILAARIHSERSTRRVRISTWRIFQLTGSSRVGWILDETSEWRYESTIDQLNDKSPLTTFVNEGKNAISWLKMKFFHGEMRSKSAMEGESILRIAVGINYNLKRFLLYNCTVLDMEYLFQIPTSASSKNTDFSWSRETETTTQTSSN